MTATQDRDLRQALHGTLESLQPSPAPLETIIRRSRGIHLRRAGAAAGALGLAGIIAVASLALRGGQQPAVPAAPPAITAGPGGVFASGTAEGHPWQLAVQNIADPGYRCLPAITINGTDADPVHPDPGNAAAVGLGPAIRDTGFAFIQLPAGVGRVIVNGRPVQAVIVTACGYRYRLVGFSYPLASRPRVTLAQPYPGWPAELFVPTVTALPPAQATTPENDGLWINADTAQDVPTPGMPVSGLLASGTLTGGQDWTINLQVGPDGDCYEFYGLNNAEMGYCGPVSTPAGPETIMALPLGFSSPSVGAATGYAFQVSPGTGRIKAILDNGTSVLATPRVVDGRRYVAFVVPSPRSVDRLIWLDAAGRIMASTTEVPLYGYTQFQP